MANDTQKWIQYLHDLLNEANIVPSIPDSLKEIEGLEAVDQTIRNLRDALKSIGNGNLSDQINGRGYLIGQAKGLQSTLRSLIWQTKAISSGDFSHQVLFLGDFSDAFNSMVKKLESNINEIKEAKALFELFFEMIPDATMIVSVDTLTIFNCNQEFEAITGLSKKDLYGKSLRNIRFFKDEHQEAQFMAFVKSGEKPQYLSLELDLHMDSNFQGLFSSSMIHIGHEKYILSVVKNVTEFKALEEQIKKSEEIHRLLADNASDVIWTMDLTGKFTYISPSVEKLRGYTVEEVMAQSHEELLCPASLVHLEKGLEEAIYAVKHNLPFKVFRDDVEQPCKDGTTVWTDLTVSGIYDKSNHFVGMLGVSRDITERRKMEAKIRRLSEIDRLTQLYNRFKLDVNIKREMDHAIKNNMTFALIMLDIDNFKMVNDTYGHIVGDEVLKEFAQILIRTICKGDTVGRWGGEEFMVILPRKNAVEGQKVAEKFREKVSNHIFSGVGHLTASFGVSEFEEELTEIELVSRADKALYEAKKSGKNSVCRYKS
ncbi:sensor domain-containing diguanylate cyclase [Fusibacter ferrireducens]|uniref:Diguanylate cyclase n=1 Tax=Fusibacter ferrireducens TaxID=2785058 RepID=A0ABR9ZUW9_9FIRM|nr:diguanylate cyclase [Fusibacter ferrireducens]MBF4694235.1 diguanylate cyclase [Fusibacter ferrireducens]